MLNKILSFIFIVVIVNIFTTGLYNAYMDYNDYVSTFMVGDIKCITNYTWLSSTTGCAQILK